MTIWLRRATTNDARFVWELNNHPSVRAQSVSTASIPWESHVCWFGRRVVDPATLFLVGLSDGIEVAVVRFDIQEREATIGVAVSPTFRGRGLGAEVIAAATEELARLFPGTRAVAWIRPENAASLKAFTRAGYVRVGSGELQGVPLARFERG